MERNFKARVQTIRKEVEIDFKCEFNENIKYAEMYFLKWIFEVYGKNEKGQPLFIKIIELEVM